MDTPSDPFFYYALIPDSPVQEEVTAFKFAAAERFGSSRALRSPAHITLVPPIRASVKVMRRMDGIIRDVAESWSPMAIECQDFGAFPPRVIFVQVAHEERLMALAKTLKTRLEDAKLPVPASDRPFRPHMTIAFRDLAEADFHKAWSWFSRQSFQRNWNAEGVWKLMHRGSHWEPVQCFAFGMRMDGQSPDRQANL